MELANGSQISEVTRRDIRRMLIREEIRWPGDLEETEFLNRLYNLTSLPSNDHRFDNAEGDIWQHRINNPEDWDDWWVFSDKRFQLAGGADEVYLNFLAEIVHPAVRANREEARKIVEQFNALLAPDGWELVETSTISRRSVYGPRRLTSSRHLVDAANSVAEVVDADYIHQQINRMTAAVDTDPDLAIGTAKELVESCCRTILSERGKPVDDKPDLHRLVRRTMEELQLVPEGVPESKKGATLIKAILGSVAAVAQSLGQLRNFYGTGHGKDGKTTGLGSRHARLAVGAATTLVRFLFDTHRELNRNS